MKQNSKSPLGNMSARPRLAGLAIAAIIVSVGGATLARLAERPARAFPTCPTCGSQLFGMVGITAGQTARLNVITSGPPNFPSGPPTGAILSFVDSNGNQLPDPVSGLPS